METKQQTTQRLEAEFHSEIQVGPGGWCAKVYKTERGARNAHLGLNVDVRREGSK